MRTTIKDLLEQLRGVGFGRPYNAYMVNFRYVESIIENEVLLSVNNLHLPLSRSYKKAFKEDYMKYLEGNLSV